MSASPALLMQSTDAVYWEFKRSWVCLKIKHKIRKPFYLVVNYSSVPRGRFPWDRFNIPYACCSLSLFTLPSKCPWSSPCNCALTFPETHSPSHLSNPTDDYCLSLAVQVQWTSAPWLLSSTPIPGCPCGSISISPLGEIIACWD